MGILIDYFFISLKRKDKRGFWYPHADKGAGKGIPWCSLQ